MGYRGRNNHQRMNDYVIVKYELSSSTDAYGKEQTETQIKVADIPCNIQEYSGSRLFEYQSNGWTYPLNITMRKPMGKVIGVKYQGVDLVIKSIQEDSNNAFNVIIMADKPELDNNGN